jgi:hypothetical protein
MSKSRKKGKTRRLPRKLNAQELLQFWEVRVFSEAWEDLKLTSDDLLDLQMEIILNPTGAPVVPGTGRLRKLRFSPEAWPIGKSGALRVCYVYFEEFGEVLLAIVYPKTEKDDLTGDEKTALRELIARHEVAYAKRAKKRRPLTDDGKELGR